MISVHKCEIWATKCVLLTKDYNLGYFVCIVTLGHHSTNSQNFYKQYTIAYNTHSAGTASFPSLDAKSQSFSMQATGY